MSNNHLIIGIGGTGGKVIKAFRKAMYEEFRSVDPAPRNGGNNAVHVNYLYIDSSNRDLTDSESWRTQGDVGALIALNKRHQLSIVYGDLQTRLRDREHYPVTHRYIGDRELWTDIFSQMKVQEAAGGQMRRLGVALFEPHCQSFVERVTASCNELSQASGIQGTNFHVCCGLAGGTGSGAFVHVIAQLRATFPSDRDYPIYLYLLLPERDSHWASNGERTNYYANGYAALQELNAYLLSDAREGPGKGGPQFAPYDLTGRSLRFENLAMGNQTRLLGRVQSCFVLSNVNEQNLVIGIENEEIHSLLAQMIFQRVFLIDSAETGQYRGLRDAITLENTAVHDESLATDPNTKVRSVRFLTFGIKRLIVPEEEIREHFAANFASQAALQMLYNNWPAETGGNAFLGEKKNTSFKFARGVPQADLTEDAHHAGGPAIPGNLEVFPVRQGLGNPVFQRRQPFPFPGFGATAARGVGVRKRIQPGIEPQATDQGTPPGDTRMSQMDTRIPAIADQGPPPRSQPSADGLDRLHRPIHRGLMAPLRGRVRPFGRGQDR